MASTKGEKELKTDWPVEKGTTAETTKQTGMAMTMVATEGSLVPRRLKAGIDD